MLLIREAFGGDSSKVIVGWRSNPGDAGYVGYCGHEIQRKGVLRSKYSIHKDDSVTVIS